jgi:hypothetical protein
MVHREPVIFEQSPGEGHLKSSLNQGSTEVFPANILVLVDAVKWRSQEFGSEFLGGSCIWGFLHHPRLVVSDFVLHLFRILNHILLLPPLEVQKLDN